MATDNSEIKCKAVNYLREYEIPKSIENLLNTLVVNQSDDPFGYMAEYFDQLAKPPTIANVTASEIFSTGGYSSFNVKIEGLLHGNVQEFSCLAAPIDDKPEINIKQPKGKTPVPGSETKLKVLVEDGHTFHDSKNETVKVKELITNINSSIKIALLGCKLYDQREVDRLLASITEKRPLSSKAVVTQGEKSQRSDVVDYPNDELEIKEDPREHTVHLDTLTVSLAVAHSASYLQNCQLYHSLYQLSHEKEPTSLSLPTPMITVLSCGKRTSGKLYLIKDVIIFTQKDVPSLQALKQLTMIYHQLVLVVQQKMSGHIATENGALAPPLDKPEQALDFLRDAMAAAGYLNNNDISIALRCSPADIYDKDKQKYEMCANAFKSTDELINVYSDLCDRYPEVKIIINPLVSQNHDGWVKLNEKIADKCFMVNEECSFNKRCPVNELSEKLNLGSAISVQGSSTVTEFLEQAKKVRGSSRILLMSANTVISHEDYIIDMAVVIEVDFVIFGCPGRFEHLQKYNRLIAIEENLKGSNIFMSKRPVTLTAVNVTEEKENEEHHTL